MGIMLFKKPYTVRKHQAQEIVNGYAVAPFFDVTMKLNVAPLGSDDLQALPEGERAVKRVNAFGPDKITSADDAQGVPGDYLYYYGQWYKCISSVYWDHTFLRHYESQFVLLPMSEQPPPPISLPPKETSEEDAVEILEPELTEEAPPEVVEP